MGIRGQRPTPTALRLIQGRPIKHAAAQAEPLPDGRPKCPARLTKEQRAVWRQFITPAAWLTSADVPLAVVFVCLYAEFMANPAGTQAARVSNLRGAMASLGFDASSRARMAWPPHRRSKPARYLF